MGLGSKTRLHKTERASREVTEKSAFLFRRAFWNTVSNYIGKIVTLGVGFVLTPLLLHGLGAETYGLWVLAGSVVAYGGLLDLGIASALTKYIAEFRAKGQVQDARDLVATALSLYLMLAVVVIGLGAALAFFFPFIFNVSPEQRTEAVWLVFVASIGVGLAIPCATPTAILRGLHRFDIINALNVVGTMLSFFATLAILFLGGSVVAIVAANIALTLVMQIPVLWVIHRLAPDLQFHRLGLRRALVRRVASFSSSLFLLNVAGRLQAKTDEIVIGVFLPVAQVTPYAISHRLSDVAKIFTDQFTKVLLPLASELHAENDRGRLRALYVISTRVTIASFMPFGCILAILAAPLLSVWVGETYAPYAPLVVILTLAGLVDMSQWSASHVLQGMARHQPLAYMSIGSGIANLILSAILIQPFGLVGVALGTLIPTTVESFGLVMPYAMRVVGVSKRQALTEIFLPSGLPALPTASLLYLLREMFQPDGWIVLGALGLVGIGVYVSVYLVVGASELERRAYAHIASHAFGVARRRLGWN